MSSAPSSSSDATSTSGGTGTPVTIGSGFDSPYGVGVDLQGNVFVSDVGKRRIVELPVGPRFVSVVIPVYLVLGEFVARAPVWCVVVTGGASALLLGLYAARFAAWHSFFF